MNSERRLVMRKKIGIVLIGGALLLACATGAMAAQVKMKFYVPALQCASSGVRATASAKAVSGVIEAEDDFSSNSLTVTFDDTKTSVEKIKEALKKDHLPAEGEPEIVR